MKRRSKLSIQVYRAITVTAIGLMIGAAPMRVMTVQAQETQKNQEQQSDYQKLDYKVFEDSSERLLEWSDIYMLSNEDIRIAKNEIYARHGRKFSSEDLQQYFSQLPWYQGTIEPDQFDENSLNEIERANVNFLDQEYQKGTGAYNASVADSILLRVKGQSEALQIAVIEDKIGMDSFAQRVTVQYKPADGKIDEEEPATVYLGDFYRKDGEICGNIGYRLGADRIDGGNASAWYNGHWYESVIESEEYGDYYQTSLLYGLYEDGLKIAWCWVTDEMLNGWQGAPEWLLTENFIYASDYNNGLNVFDRNGNVTAQVSDCQRVLAVYNGFVYYMTKDGMLMCAEEGTMAAQQSLFQTNKFAAGAVGTHFLYQTEEGIYAYDLETNLSTKISDSIREWGDDFVAGLDCAYIGQSEYNSGQYVLESVSYDGLERETVCTINGISYANLLKAEGNLIYLVAGPIGGDFESPEGNMNEVKFAIDLEDGITYVLGADWFP